MDANKQWTCELDVCTKQRFLESEALQNRAFVKYMDHIEGYMRGGEDELDLFDLRGQQIIGIHDPSKPITITPVGLMAAGHRWGAEGTRAYMEHLEKNGWVSDFSRLDGDTAKKFMAIETRLRKFQNASYD